MQTTDVRPPTLETRPPARRPETAARSGSDFSSELNAVPDRADPAPRPARDARAADRSAQSSPARTRDGSREAAEDGAPTRQSEREPVPAKASGADTKRSGDAAAETSADAPAEAKAALPASDDANDANEAAAAEAAARAAAGLAVDPAALPPPPSPAQAPAAPPAGQGAEQAAQAALAAQAAAVPQAAGQPASAAEPSATAVAAAAQASGGAKPVHGPNAAAPQAASATGQATTAAPGEDENGAADGDLAAQAAAVTDEAAALSSPEAPKAARTATPPALPQPELPAEAAAPPSTVPGSAEAKTLQAQASQDVPRNLGFDPAAGKATEGASGGPEIPAPGVETVKVSVTPLPPPSVQPLAALPDATQPQTAGQPAAPQTPPTPVAMLPIEIGMRAMEGLQRFEIRLSPETLGRVDVRLDIAEDGGVKAHIVVDRVDTLGLLQRDARTLERAFEQAGLKTGDGALQFSLGGQSQNGQNASGQNSGAREQTPEALERAEASAREIAAALRSVGVPATGLDIRI